MSTTMNNLKTKLLSIQAELKAPKGRYNNYGGFNYRSAEDIMEAVKPICATHGVVLTITDEIVYLGERYYVMATACLADCESDEQIEVRAFAREAEEKKGMDDSQVTGATSSYARKYALNGLFAIDDTKDADTDEYNTITKGEKKPAKTSEPKKAPATVTNREKVMIVCEERGIDPKELAKKYKLTRNTSDERFAEVLKELGA